MTTSDIGHGNAHGNLDISEPERAYIVETKVGPLVGTGRWRRMLPFALTALISMVIAVPATSWVEPELALVGQLLLAVAFVASLVSPWERFARHAQLFPPFLFLIGIVMLTAANGTGIASPFVTMSVIPLMWLAIYERRFAVALAALLGGLGLWLVAPVEDTAHASGAVATAVLFIVCGGMGLTLHGIVASARNSELALRRQQLALERSAAVLDAIPERLNLYRVSDHVIAFCNQAWATQYKVGTEEAIGRVLDEFLSDDEKVGLRSQLALLSPANPILVDQPREAPGPDLQYFEWVDRYMVGPDGPQVLSIGRDVTRRQHAELALAESEAQYRELADKSADVVWRFSTVPTPHFDYMSPSIEATIGYPPSYFLDDFTHILDILDAESREAITRAVSGETLAERFDMRFRHANGSIVVGETHTVRVRNGLQGTSRDVTELRLLQDEMSALALRDSLTGLANRRLFNELFEADLARTQRSNLPLAVAFLDLDGLKSVNDIYGHDAGDVALCETATRLMRIVRGADTVARLGGDEFAIVYAPNDASSYNLVARIDAALAEPIWITATSSVLCPASIGVADTTVVGYDSTALLAAADEAMYEAKRARRAIRAGEMAET